MDLNRPWADYSYVAFDTETSGAWPVGCDIVEFGAVKWQGGREIDHLQFLFKPREPMTDFIIGIHGITNEMVASAPAVSSEIQRIADFFRGSIPMAHHAPFDLGFVALDMERADIPFPQEPVLCTSLLARQLIHGVQNHKLQTLVAHFGINGGAAHRALDDARSCLHVGLKCFEAKGPHATLRDLLNTQQKNLRWENFSILRNEDSLMKAIAKAASGKTLFHFIYDRGSEFRSALPLGLVRNPDGDFMQAICQNDGIAKRFYLGKIKDFKS